MTIRKHIIAFINQLPTNAKKPEFAWAIAMGLTAFTMACFWRGWDWYISESQTAIISSALFRFYEIPHFSYFWNHGSYLFQDPQNPFFSILLPLLAIFPSALALRIAVFILVVFGYLGCFHWLKRFTSEHAALVGASAWCLNLWTLNRIAVGNDFFLYALLLPWVFIFMERMKKRRDLVSALELGGLLGFLLLAPAVHALVYFMIPLCFLWVLVQVPKLKQEPSKKLRKLLFLSLLALAVSLVICFPKILGIHRLPGVRVVPPEPKLRLRGLLVGLVYPFFAGPLPIQKLSVYGPHEFEGAPLLTVFAIGGLCLYKLKSIKNYLSKIPKTAFYWIVGAAALGLSLVYSNIFILLLNSKVSMPLRVICRFTILFSVAYTLMAALGWDFLLLKKTRKIQMKWTMRFLAAHILIFFVSAVPFYILPQHNFWPDFPIPKLGLAASSLERSETKSIKGIRATDINPGKDSRWTRFNVESVETGYAIAGLPHSMGNLCFEELPGGNLCSKYLERVYKIVGAPGSETPICKGDCDGVRAGHNHIWIDSKRSQGSVVLSLRYPQLGFEKDASAFYRVDATGPESMKVTWNAPSGVAPRFELKVVPVIARTEWMVWFFALIILSLVYIRSRFSRVGLKYEK